jgi:hypothetical protein
VVSARPLILLAADKAQFATHQSNLNKIKEKPTNRSIIPHSSFMTLRLLAPDTWILKSSTSSATRAQAFNRTDSVAVFGAVIFCNRLTGTAPSYILPNETISTFVRALGGIHVVLPAFRTMTWRPSRSHFSRVCSLRRSLRKKYRSPRKRPTDGVSSGYIM